MILRADCLCAEDAMVVFNRWSAMLGKTGIRFVEIDFEALTVHAEGSTESIEVLRRGETKLVDLPATPR